MDKLRTVFCSHADGANCQPGKASLKLSTSFLPGRPAVMSSQTDNTDDTPSRLFKKFTFFFFTQTTHNGTHHLRWSNSYSASVLNSRGSKYKQCSSAVCHPLKWLSFSILGSGVKPLKCVVSVNITESLTSTGHPPWTHTLNQHICPHSCTETGSFISLLLAVVHKTGPFGTGTELTSIFYDSQLKHRNGIRPRKSIEQCMQKRDLDFSSHYGKRKKVSDLTNENEFTAVYERWIFY